MITISHAVYSWALAEKVLNDHSQRNLLFMALIGGILPDIAIYFFFSYYKLIMSAPTNLIWSELYFSSAWTPIFTLAHSFILWLVLLIVSRLYKKRWLFWLSIGAFTHSVTDFFVHNTDAYAHFWPFFNWKFFSPLSYWDPNYYGEFVSRLDSFFVLLLLLFLFRRYQSTTVRLSLALLAIFYLVETLLTPHSIIH
tara:strand:+ start:803 stop:1390 length:588 start_codon:yes stop_codon:yes gene_type:complete